VKRTKQQVAEARKVYDLFWDSYQSGDVDTFAATRTITLNCLTRNGEAKTMEENA